MQGQWYLDWRQSHTTMGDVFEVRYSGFFMDFPERCFYRRFFFFKVSFRKGPYDLTLKVLNPHHQYFERARIFFKGLI